MNEPWIPLVGITALAFAALLASLAFFSDGARVVARFELVRLARRGRQPLLRGLVAFGTLVGLVLTLLAISGDVTLRGMLSGRDQVSVDRLPLVGEAFLITFLFVQVLAVYLTAPLVLAASVAQEKERGTLDELLVSDLSPFDVAAGKFLAGWLAVLGVAVAGAPSLAAASLFGGIDLDTLVGGAVIVVYGSASLGAYAVLAAAGAKGLGEALVPVYSVLAMLTILGLVAGMVPGMAFFSPAASMVWLVAARGVMGAGWLALVIGLFAVCHAIYTAAALRWAAKQLVTEPPPAAPPVPEREPFPERIAVYGVEPRKPDPATPRPTIPEGQAFGWRERRASRGSERSTLVWLAAGGLAIGVLFLSASALNRQQMSWAGDAFNPLARLSLTALAVFAPLAVGVRAAGSVARERERRTLDSILVTPSERREILAAKLAGSMAEAWRMVLFVVGILILTAAFGGVYPPGALAGLFAGVGSIVLAAAMGVYFSVRARTSLRAVLALNACLFVLWVGPVMLAPLVQAGEPRGLVTALSPPVGVFRSALPWRFYRAPGGDDYDGDAIRASVVMGVLGVVAAYGVWHAARQRFERLGR